MIQHLENIKHKDSKNFFLIAGPCAIESEEMAMDIAERIIKITEKHQREFQKSQSLPSRFLHRNWR